MDICRLVEIVIRELIYAAKLTPNLQVTQELAISKLKGDFGLLHYKDYLSA